MANLEIAVSLGSVGMAFVFAYLGSKMQAEYLQMLFVFLSMIILASTGGVMAQIGIDNSASANLQGLLAQEAVVAVWGFYVAIAIYVVMFVFQVFKSMSDKNRSMRRVRL